MYYFWQHPLYSLNKTCPAIRSIFLGFQPLKGWKPKKDAATPEASGDANYHQKLITPNEL